MKSRMSRHIVRWPIDKTEAVGGDIEVESPRLRKGSSGEHSLKVTTPHLAARAALTALRMFGDTLAIDCGDKITGAGV
jgi:hypothetical protein